MKTINAKGKACPEPVMMTKAEVERGETELDVLLDNPVSAFNVMHFLEGNGFSVQLKDDDGTIAISARKSEQPSKAALFKKQPAVPEQEAEVSAMPQTATPSQAQSPKLPSGKFSVLITGQALGRTPELGEVLMKNFLGALSQMERPPLVVALVNDGVKLSLYDSSSCDHLKNLEKKGVSIMVCGTCVNYFNIMDHVGVGSVSHMLDIIKTLDCADKVMTI